LMGFSIREAVLCTSFYFFLVFVGVLWRQRTVLNQLASATADQLVRWVVDVGNAVAGLPVEDDATLGVMFAREATTVTSEITRI